VRIGADGPLQMGLNEVRIGLTVPWFAIELARQRLHPAHYNATVVTAAMYSPREGLTAGFLDRVVPAGELAAAVREEATRLAALDLVAHAGSKRRARASALAALRAAIERDLGDEDGFSALPARAA
jgi:enoyl-CoA hydratase